MQDESLNDEFHGAIKASRWDLNAGNLKLARNSIMNAFWLAREPRYAEEYKVLGMVMHRRAMVDAAEANPHGAQFWFENALLQLERDQDELACVIAMRDYGMFEYVGKDEESGRKRIIEALARLEQLCLGDDRIQKEVIVTTGFHARTELKGSERKQAINTLRWVDERLKGYKKPIYELDNLAWWIDSLPLGPERLNLSIRAAKLCVRLGNYSRASEFLVLLGGGKPLRGIHRLLLH